MIQITLFLPLNRHMLNVKLELLLIAQKHIFEKEKNQICLQVARKNSKISNKRLLMETILYMCRTVATIKDFGAF